MNSVSHPAKRKVSVTLDADLVDRVRSAGENLSARTNDALRADIERTEANARLRQLLDELDAERGPLDTPEDEAVRQHFEQLWDDLEQQSDVRPKGRGAA